jgi:hypothetical protein
MLCLRPIIAILLLLTSSCHQAVGRSNVSNVQLPAPAFQALATKPLVSADERECITYYAPPKRAELQRLAAQPGTWEVVLSWERDFGPDAFIGFRGVRLANVRAFGIDEMNADADALIHEITRQDTGLANVTSLFLAQRYCLHGFTTAGLKELASPNSGLKRLTSLNLGGAPITDEGVKELVGPETCLKSLVDLNLGGTVVTDKCLKELASPDCGLKALTQLYVLVTSVTDAGLQELARPDSGLKGLTLLDVRNTSVTGAGVAALKKVRPGLRVKWGMDD